MQNASDQCRSSELPEGIRSPGGERIDFNFAWSQKVISYGSTSIASMSTCPLSTCTNRTVCSPAPRSSLVQLACQMRVALYWSIVSTGSGLSSMYTSTFPRLLYFEYQRVICEPSKVNSASLPTTLE